MMKCLHVRTRFISFDRSEAFIEKRDLTVLIYKISIMRFAFRDKEVFGVCLFFVFYWK